MAAGNKVFGAALLRKSDLSVLIAGTNNEIENPLWHGEVSTIKRFHKLPKAERPQPTDLIFLSTHEPCSTVPVSHHLGWVRQLSATISSAMRIRGTRSRSRMTFAF